MDRISKQIQNKMRYQLVDDNNDNYRFDDEVRILLKNAHCKNDKHCRENQFVVEMHSNKNPKYFTYRSLVLPANLISLK